MRNQPWYLFVVLAVILGGLAYFAYLKPHQDTLDSIRAERIKVEDEVMKLRIKKKELDAMERELTQLNAKLAELETVIPRRMEVGDILRNMQQMATDQTLALVNFAPAQRETVRDFYAEWPIPIDVVGTYHNVGLFLDRLLHFPRIFNVDNISIKSIPNQTAETTIQAHITAKTYFFMTEAGAPAAKSPQAGR